MSSTTIDDRAVAELEQKFDPDMRFRLTWPPASTVLKVLLIALSCFHYYTAGFGLLRETTHRGVHLAFVLGLIFIVFEFRHSAAAGTQRPRSAWAPGGVPWIDWLLAFAVALSVLYIPYVFNDLAFRVGNPSCTRRRDGLDPVGAAARGHASQHGLAAAADRDRLHGLCAGRPDLPGPAQACRRELGPAGQPPVPHQPGHLRHRGRRGRDLCLSLRAVRRAGHAHRPGAIVPRHRVDDRRPLRRRAGQGERVRLGDVRHAVRLVGGQRGHCGFAHHSRDDPRRLSARVRRRGGSGGVHRRPDHAAGARRGGVPDDRVPRRPVPDHHRGRGGAGVHALLRRVHAGALRGQALRAARSHRRRDAQAARVAAPALADIDSVGAADRHPGQRPHAVPGCVHRHHVVRHRRAHHRRRPRGCAQLGSARCAARGVAGDHVRRHRERSAARGHLRRCRRGHAVRAARVQHPGSHRLGHAGRGVRNRRQIRARSRRGRGHGGHRDRRGHAHRRGLQARRPSSPVPPRVWRSTWWTCCPGVGSTRRR